MLISPKTYDAVLFDLDGVLTMTMKIHAACWKTMFDDFLKRRAERNGGPFRPFDVANDYKPYVDGKLRYDGVRSFLASRGISLPEGTPNDSVDQETICGLGNRKDRLVNDIIATEGVEVLNGSIEVAHRVRQDGLKTAVVSASKNCQKILAAAGIRDLFDCVIDGNVASQLGLPGKPAPDTFLEAARLLDVDPSRAVVVEDAVSGVQAGRAGRFALVIGIDHHGDKQALIDHGADIVVEDLSEIL
ncbi:MAG: beta-phosphoglucomutase family hydrolase [Deltaproteobacteria bacterium]|jgi:beta-phosphoglucomutase family hydrolase|nr:beta-phosphoglucomutase family hydrolase [Deltaproteobacteria bacterium]